MDNRQHTRKPSRVSQLLTTLNNVLPNLFQLRIGQALPSNYFQGIDPNDKHAVNKLRRRRAKNKVAKASRKANR